MNHINNKEPLTSSALGPIVFKCVLLIDASDELLRINYKKQMKSVYVIDPPYFAQCNL